MSGSDGQILGNYIGAGLFICFFSFIGGVFMPSAEAFFALQAVAWTLMICLGIIGHQKQKEHDRNAVIQKRNYKESLQRVTPDDLFILLNQHIEQLRRINSTTTEKVVVGHEKLDMGVWGETSMPKYSSRTRDVPEYQVEKAVLDTPPDDAELEIMNRGTAVLPDLIGKYRSGKNLEIIKRILERLPSRQVGQTFEKYGMFEEAEQWFSSHGLFDDGKRVRNEMKINQTVIQGDYVDDRDTFVRDSVVNRSNIGASDVLNDFEIQSILTPSNKKPKKRIVKRKKDDKISKIKELKELLDSGAISDEDYEKMKREIIG